MKLKISFLFVNLKKLKHGALLGGKKKQKNEFLLINIKGTSKRNENQS